MKKRDLIILFIVAVLIFAGAFFVIRFLRTPMNEPLDLVETDTTEPTEIPVSQAEESDTTSSSQNDRICNASGIMRILEIGIASPFDIGHYGADAIRLVVVDFDQGIVNTLAIPADLWVDTPAELIEDLGDLAPLNMIYYTAYENASGNADQVKTQKATEVLAQTLLDVFGFAPDHYITINGDAFIQMVDDLGGIEITLATAIDATGEHFGTFPAGQQIINGEKTLDFVRILSPNGIGPDTFGRLERQNMVIRALLDAILSPSNWDAAPELFKDARKLAVTDLSVNQVSQLVCMIDQAGNEAEILIVDDSMVTTDDQNRMIPDIEAIRDLIGELEGN